MKLYIAAPWVDRDNLPAIAAKFEAEGHTITWRWWATDDIAEGDDTLNALREQAENDFWGVYNCDTLVLLNTKKSEGKAVEQGIALALNIPIIAVGLRGNGTSKNVFHYMRLYTWVETIEEAIKELADASESE